MSSCVMIVSEFSYQTPVEVCTVSKKKKKQLKNKNSYWLLLNKQQLRSK